MPIRLKLDGKPLDLNPPTPTETRIMGFLNKQPADDLFTPRELSSRAGVSYDHIRHIGGSIRLETYSTTYRGLRIWGNPQAISVLLAGLAEVGS